MTFAPSRLPQLIARTAAFLAVLVLASCGGSVGPSTNVPNQQAIVILPASSATSQIIAYSGLPTTLSITGGNGSYIIASNNQAVIPSPGSVIGNSFTIIPSPIAAAEVGGIVLSVRDTATAAVVTATVTVRAGTVNNNVTITPSSTQTASCSPALCSGGDAEVKVTISQGGVPLAARGIRFDVISGDFRYIVTPVGTSPEQLATSQLVATDETGIARARIRATALAPNQTALLRITDVVSGAYRQTSFAIAQVTQADPSFYTLPASLDLIGPQQGVCATAAVDFFIFGGTPPYSVASTSPSFRLAFPVPFTPDSPVVVSASGGKFTISATGGTCPSDGVAATLIVTDAAGRTRQVPVTNKPTTAALPAFVVSPDSVSLDSCSAVASVSLAGGTGSYFATTGSGLITATWSGNTASFRRTPNTNTPATLPVDLTASVSDGISALSVKVTITGGISPCP
ncbi:MAG: hypothetical protein IPP91_08445 [Betaproteobacteria bacterium]|nr:hypothetical protein [Betaproteobacteria bacterium]